MLTVSPSRLLPTFLLLLFLLQVTAAPSAVLTDTDMAMRVKKRKTRDSSEAKIKIHSNGCGYPRIYLGRAIGFKPVLQPDLSPNKFRGQRDQKDCQSKPIAAVHFRNIDRETVYNGLQTIEGSSEWDYIDKAMEFLQEMAKGRQLEFKFETGGEERWQKLLKKCRGKQGSEEQGELKTSEAHTSSGLNQERRPSYGEFGKKGKMPTFTDILVGGSVGNTTESKA
ncbi:hypothetical protein F5051DRAFT_26694 [Lentinula edodes]|nr:hypothetical protein F5051DRAFT_26694 [Lentinula edodes]